MGDDVTHKCGLCGYEGGIEEVRPRPPVYNSAGKEVAYVKANCVDRDDCKDRQRERERARRMDPDEIAARMAAFKARINYIAPVRTRAVKPWWLIGREKRRGPH